MIHQIQNKQYKRVKNLQQKYESSNVNITYRNNELCRNLKEIVKSKTNNTSF